MQIHFTSTDQIQAINVPFHEVVVVMPFTDPQAAQKASRLMASRAGVNGLLLCVFDAAQQGFIETANAAFANTQSRWFAYVAQDAFAGRNWLKNALETLEKQQGALLGFNDGKWAGELAAFGLVERAWANQNYDQLLFCPGYRQHYADVELTLLAQACGRYVYNPNSVLIEIDWEKDQKAINPEDRALFELRKQTRFDGRNIADHWVHKFA